MADKLPRSPGRVKSGAASVVLERQPGQARQPAAGVSAEEPFAGLGGGRPGSRAECEEREPEGGGPQAPRDGAVGAASGDAVENMEAGLRSVLVGEDTAPQVEGDRDPPIEEVDLVCPYCGETVTVALEADLAGELVQDCEVCCNPWRLRLGRSAGRRAVTVERLDD